MLLISNSKNNIRKCYYSQTAKFRNSEYKFCNFSELKVIDNPEPEWNKEEGYNFFMAHIQFPRMSQDPNNSYNHVHTGYSKPITMNFAAYDKKLHQQYRIYKSKEDYDTIETFGKRISHVDLINSVISLSNINHVRFEFCNFNNVIFNEIRFTKTYMRLCKFSYSLVENCIFDDLEISNEIVNQFIRTVFVNVKFNDNLWSRAYFSNCTFIGCIFVNHYIYNCNINSQFINCDFVNLGTLWCTTPGSKEYNFNINHFKALCQNCNFE